MNKNISVIVFDLGNVLIPFDYQVAIKKIDKFEEGLGEKFMSFYNKNYHYHRAFESGKIPVNNFIEIMRKALNYKIDPETFCRIYSEIFNVNEDVVNLLPDLKKKYQLVLLSNTNYIHRKYGWGNYDFLNYFDKLILSHEIGAVKPEPEIYKAVEDFTQKPPEEHFYIDDIQEYIDAAKLRGWNGVVFTGYNDLLKSLP